MARKKIAYFLILSCAAIMMYTLHLSCVWKQIFHVPCCLCGMTRAVLAILRLDIASAVRYHFMVLFLPLIFWFYIKDGKIFASGRANTAVLIFILAGFIVRWALNFFGI